MSPGEHPYLSISLAQIGTPISCLKSSMSNTWVIDSCDTAIVLNIDRYIGISAEILVFYPK